MTQVMLPVSGPHLAASVVGDSGAISLTREECWALMNMKMSKRFGRREGDAQMITNNVVRAIVHTSAQRSL